MDNCPQGIEPGPAVFFGQRRAGGHLGDVLFGMVVVAVNKHAAKLLSHLPAHLALAAGRDPHHHEADGAYTIGRE
jgi:hypothetical protein